MIGPLDMDAVRRQARRSSGLARIERTGRRTMYDGRICRAWSVPGTPEAGAHAMAVRGYLRGCERLVASHAAREEAAGVTYIRRSTDGWPAQALTCVEALALIRQPEVSDWYDGEDGEVTYEIYDSPAADYPDGDPYADVIVRREAPEGPGVKDIIPKKRKGA